MQEFLLELLVTNIISIIGIIILFFLQDSISTLTELKDPNTAELDSVLSLTSYISRREPLN